MLQLTDRAWHKIKISYMHIQHAQQLKTRQNCITINLSSKAMATEAKKCSYPTSFTQ